MHRKRNTNDIPFSPRRLPFFYGWVVLLAGTVGVLMSIPGQTMGVSSFTEHLLAALGLTREELSRAYMFGTAASGLILTWAGKLYDRWGARVVAALSCVGLGGMLVLASQSDRIAHGLAGTFGMAGSVWAFWVILLAFFGIRFCGQGVLTMVSRNMVMKWFDRHRGLANGLAGVGISLGFSASPPVLDGLIEAFSWRGAWLAIAAVVGAGFVVVVLAVYRDNPEDCGLVPDGSLHDDEKTVAARLAHRQFTLGEASRTYSFWIFALSMGMFGLYMTALTFHVVSIFEAGGMTKEIALSIFFPASIIAVTCHFAAGWISDYVPLKYVLVVMLAGMAVSMLSLMTLSPETRWVMIVGNGVLAGMFGVISAVTWPRFFGRTHLGAVSGLSMAIIVLSSALGPWMFSVSKAVTGSYAPAGGICLSVTTALLLGALAASNPQKKRAVAPSEDSRSPGDQT